MNIVRINSLMPYPDVSDDMPLTEDDLKYLQLTWGDIRGLCRLAARAIEEREGEK